MPFFLVVLFVLIGIWSPAAAQESRANPLPIAFEVVASGFDQPLFLTSPRGDPRLFVVEQSGQIRIVENGETLGTPFIDLSDRISFGGERGLLGLAFHPDYVSNRRFFVNYTDTEGDTQVVTFRASDDPNIADVASAETILTVQQPAGNHNGGWLGFGPDGYLYIAMGDGGGAGDPNRNGQNPDTLLAKILRLDVDGGTPYAIPAGNPFADGGGAPEVFLLGVRNPWRPSFDGNDLYVADVGQRRFEEITIVDVATDAGANLGWNVMEGAACYRPRQSCDQAGLTQPDFVYPTQEGCTIIGGYVYRGAAIPEAEGRYFFADFCLGTVSSLQKTNGTLDDLIDVTAESGALGSITSFGIDAENEMYVIFDDSIAKMVPAD